MEREWVPEDEEAPGRPRRRLMRWVGLALVLGIVAVVFVTADDHADDGRSGATPRRSTTTAVAVEFDYLPSCIALSQFRSAGDTLGRSRDPELVRTALEVMARSLDELTIDIGHPKLVEKVEIALPVVQEASAELREVSDAAVLEVLAQDPRFSSPEIVQTMAEISQYPLRCPGGSA